MKQNCSICLTLLKDRNICPTCGWTAVPSPKHIPWTRTSVMCIETGEIFDSAQEAAEFIGCGKSAMSNHLSGRHPHVRGKHFKRITAVLSHEVK